MENQKPVVTCLSLVIRWHQWSRAAFLAAALFLAGADLDRPTGFLGATWLTSPTKELPPGGFGALRGEGVLREDTLNKTLCC